MLVMRMIYLVLMNLFRISYTVYNTFKLRLANWQMSQWLNFIRVIFQLGRGFVAGVLELWLAIVIVNYMLCNSLKYKYWTEFSIVLMLDGISEIGVHERSNICNLIWLIHLIRSRSVTNLIFPKRPIFLSCVSNIL